MKESTDRYVEDLEGEVAKLNGDLDNPKKESETKKLIQKLIDDVKHGLVFKTNAMTDKWSFEDLKSAYKKITAV